MNNLFIFIISFLGLMSVLSLYIIIGGVA